MDDVREKELAILIVELLTMVTQPRTEAAKRLYRRAGRAIEGLPEAIAQGEANYRAYCMASPDHKPEGTREALGRCALMLEEYGIKDDPADELGRCSFTRIMMEATVGEIRAFLAVDPDSAAT